MDFRQRVSYSTPRGTAAPRIGGRVREGCVEGRVRGCVCVSGGVKGHIGGFLSSGNEWWLENVRI